MKTPEDVIIRPFITEKMEYLKDSHRQYAFKVNADANKIEIKQAVEEMYKVTVRAVNVMNRMGKKRRMRFSIGRRADWKKAIVTLKEGDAIEFFK